MTILVTGATSGLGRNAVEILLQQGVSVRATGRSQAVGERLRAAGAEFVAADLTQLSRAAMVTLMHGVDTVWHCAGLSLPWGALADFRAINTDATGRLAQAARRVGVHHFVHISTPSIYFDYRHRLQIPERWRSMQPANAYVRSKLEAEVVLRRHAASALVQGKATVFIILRPRALFGRHDRVLLPRLLARLSRGRGTLRLPRGGQALMDMTYMPNVVHAMQRASACAPEQSGRAFNITNHAPRRLAHVLQQLFAAMGMTSARIRRVPYRLAALVAHGAAARAVISQTEPTLTAYSLGVLNYDMTLDNTRAIEQLGYRPRCDMDTAIAATAEWVWANGDNH